MTQTVAQMYPARTDGNGTTWYRPARRKLVGRDGFAAEGLWGWTSQPIFADPSYGVDADGKTISEPSTYNPFDHGPPIL